MQCEDMEVKMTSRLSFTSRERDRQVKVEKVDCRDGVRFDSMEYVTASTPDARKTLSEVRRGHVARFTLNQITGNTQAHGPGHIEFWRRSNGQRPALGGSLVPGGATKTARAGGTSATARANDTRSSKPGDAAATSTAASNKTGQKAETAADPHWEYTRVDFAGNSDGNIQQRFTKFEERVHVVYGPVDQPPLTVDPDKLPEEGGWMTCDTLRVQQVADEAAGGTAGAARPSPRSSESKPGEKAQKPQGHVELLARGNVDLFGRTFNAKADQVTYDESKGQYTLRSLGSNATIYHQKKVGDDYNFVTAQEIRFWPSQNQSQAIKTRIASGSQ
jgi:hypothetical protein